MTDREKLVELINHVAEGHIVNLMQPGGAEALADQLIANGVTVQKQAKEQIRKAENCRYYTPNSFWGSGCLGTKEVDPCKGDKCEHWKPKEG